MRAASTPRGIAICSRDSATDEAAAYAAESTDESIDRDGGNGGHEVRTWFVMAGLAGSVPFTTLSYAPIPELITGMAVGIFG